MKIYLDTNVIGPNLRSEVDKRVFERLRSMPVLSFVAGAIARREIDRTNDMSLRTELRDSETGIARIEHDERVLGFHSQWDRYGGVAYPLVSDVQNDSMYQELIAIGLKGPDAQHVTQAICNGCDVFLTRDVNSIIKRYRETIERRFSIRVRTPSELLDEIMAEATSATVRPMT